MSLNDNEKRNNEITDSVQNLISVAEKVKEQGYDSRPDIKDGILKILSFIVVVGLGLAWMFAMLMIISFVSLGYLHFNIKTIISISILSAVMAGGYYCFKLFRNR